MCNIVSGAVCVSSQHKTHNRLHVHFGGFSTAADMGMSIFEAFAAREVAVFLTCTVNKLEL